MSAPTYNETQPAARFVERNALDEADEMWLKEVLGLVQPDGSLAPDDTTAYVFPPADKGPGAKDPNDRTTPSRRPDMTTPPGLANLPPEPAEAVVKKRRGPKPKPKVIRPSKPREEPKCGEYRAYSRHKRRHEPIDDACREAYREYHKKHSAESRLRKRREAERQRLTDAGVNPATSEVLSVLAR